MQSTQFKRCAIQSSLVLLARSKLRLFRLKESLKRESEPQISRASSVWRQKYARKTRVQPTIKSRNKEVMSLEKGKLRAFWTLALFKFTATATRTWRALGETRGLIQCLNWQLICRRNKSKLACVSLVQRPSLRSACVPLSARNVRSSELRREKPNLLKKERKTRAQTSLNACNKAGGERR